jgi:anaerobic ribonucleoside-triphosphate reductase activating protein
MNYAEIKTCDIANGPGVRISLFVSGCTHQCQNCFNEEAWDFQYGEKFTTETENKIIEMLKPQYIQGLTLLGGEPLEQVNQAALLPFLQKIRKELPDKTIWCYTGYTFETDILGHMMHEYKETADLLKCLDVLVDGEFVQAQKNISLQFRGSENQRIILVQDSLNSGQTILWHDEV